MIFMPSSSAVQSLESKLSQARVDIKTYPHFQLMVVVAICTANAPIIETIENRIALAMD